MSKTSETTLSLLLRLSAGLLNETQAKIVRRKIDSDPLWNHRWLQLRECGFDSGNLPDEPFVNNIDTQIVGQFVEQRLPEKTARQLETIAWQQPELLREIVIAFQAVHLPAVLEDDAGESKSDALVDRVLEMLPVHKNGHDHGLEAHVTRDNTSQAAIEIPGSRYPVTTWIAVAATVFFLAILVAARLAEYSFDQRLVEDNKSTGTATEKADHEPVQDVDPGQRLEPSEMLVDDTGDEEWKQFPIDRVVENAALSDEDDDVPDDMLIDVPQDGEFTADKSVVKSDTEKLPESNYRPIRPHWTKYNGAIGLREPGQSGLVGYGFAELLTPETEIQVFPKSWGQADVSGLGQIVVDGDTIFSIGRRIENSDEHQNEEQIEISLRQGRLAIAALVPDTRILVETGGDVWPVTVTRNDSTLVIEYVANRVRLFTRRGKLRVRGQELARNRQMVSQNGEFAKPEKTNLNTKWVDRPNAEQQLPETITEGLFNSPDLVTALGQLRNSSDDQTRIAAMHWQWTIHPADVVQVFRTHDVAHWVDAMNWLAEQPSDHLRTRMIWRQLADGPGNPEIAREFMRWVRLRDNNSLPAPPHLKKMVEFLAHDRLFVRFVSTYLLENSFGNPTGYRPQAPANLRSRALHVWRQYIGEVYKRKVESAVMNN